MVIGPPATDLLTVPWWPMAACHHGLPCASSVTGGAGFIGSHLVDRLVEEGADVVVLDDLSTGFIENLNPSAVSESPAVTELDSVRGRRCAGAAEVIYHQAARPDPSADLFSIRSPRTSLNTDRHAQRPCSPRCGGPGCPPCGGRRRRPRSTAARRPRPHA